MDVVNLSKWKIYLMAVLLITVFVISTSSAYESVNNTFKIDNNEFVKIKEHPKIESALLTEKSGAFSAQIRNQNLIQVVFELKDGDKSHIKSLEDGGAVIEAMHKNLVQARGPALQLQRMADMPFVKYVRSPLRPYKHVVSEGASVINATRLNDMGLKGQGVKIAIIDAGFSGYASKLGTELPSSVNSVSFRADKDINGSGENHGTAVAEIMYDLAPNATFYLLNFDTDVEFANAVDYAISQNIDIISMSMGFLPGPFEGTGYIDDIVNNATSRGIVWVNSAGNYAQNHWEGTYNQTTLTIGSEIWNVQDFTGGDYTNSFYAQAGDTIVAILSWNDWPYSNQDYDLILANEDTKTFVDYSENVQNGIQEPSETINYKVPSPGNYGIIIRRYDANLPVKFELYTLNENPEYDLEASSLSLPADLKDVITVGATYWSNDALEYFSSQGPTNDGRTKPDLVAPDGVSTSTYGPTNFYGTSASAPHAAGVAALLLSKYPSITNKTLRIVLKNTAKDLITPGEDNLTGSGRIDVFAAQNMILDVTAISPIDLWVGNGTILDLNATITSISGVNNATVNVSSVNNTIEKAVLENIGRFWINNTIAVNTSNSGLQNLTITVYDNESNVNNAVNLTVKVDNIPPNVLSNPTVYPSGNTAAKNSTMIKLNISISDTLSGVKNGTVDVSQINSSSPVELSYSNGYWKANVTVAAPDGIYQLNVAAYDNVSNVNNSVRLSVTADNTPPLFLNASAGNSTIEAGSGTSILSANVTDNTSGVARVTVNLSEIGGSPGASMQNSSGIWLLTVNTTVVGDFSLVVNSTDSAGNSENRTILLNATDTTPPVIEWARAAPDSIKPGGIESATLKVSIHDFANVSNIQNVRVNLTQLGGNVSQELLNNGGIWQFNTSTTFTNRSGFLVRLPVNVTDARNNSNTSISILLGIKALVNATAGNRTSFNFTVDSSTFGASITIPASTSLSGELFMAPVDLPALGGLTSAGVVLNLSGMTFNDSLKIEMQYNSSLISQNESKLRLWFYNITTGAWNITENSSVDTANRTVSGNTTHFSLFAPLIDAISPVISYVASSSITTDSATIMWNTDEVSQSLVKYGTASGSYTSSVRDTSNVTSHSLQLTGLSSGTVYYFIVNSTDQSGNSNESDEGSFTTLSSRGGSSGSGGSSSSGGGGGGGGTSGEDYSNIILKEKYDLYIMKDKVTSYSFRNISNPIMFVNITGNISVGEVNTAIEVLKNTSSLVNTPAPGNVYKNANIWVGSSGFAVPKNIKDAVIRFRIENSWLESNNVASGDIRMVKWNKSQWIQLETIENVNDGAYTIFEARTNSFSPFAITALKGEIVPTKTSETTTISAIETPPVDAGNKPDEKTPMNLAGIIVVLVLTGIILVIYLKRK